MVVCFTYYSSSLLAGCPYSYTSPGTGLIVLDNVQCAGSELRLVDCNYDPDASDDHHYEDIAVACSK